MSERDEDEASQTSTGSTGATLPTDTTASTLPTGSGTDDSPPGAVPPGARAARRRGWALPAAVAVVAALVALVAVLQWRRADDLDGDRRAMRRVQSAAAAFGEAYLTYDFRDVEGSEQRVRALVTEAFAADFSETRIPGLERLFQDIRTTTSARTTQVFVGDVGDTLATVLVIVDVTAESTATGPQVLRNLTFVLQLVRDGDRWLVDDVTPAPRPGIGGPDGETTTTTDPGAATTTTVSTTVPG